MQIKSPTKKQLNVFVLGLCLILLLFAWRSFREGNSKISFILIGLASALVIIYLIKRNFVIQFYKIWMRCVSYVGMVITGILMVAIFYLVFTPVGIFLRLIGKDILNLNKDDKLKTYWIDRPQRKFNKSDYEKQF